MKKGILFCIFLILLLPAPGMPSHPMDEIREGRTKKEGVIIQAHG